MQINHLTDDEKNAANRNRLLQKIAKNSLGGTSMQEGSLNEKDKEMNTYTQSEKDS